jgi:hypothetical protein
LFTSNLSDEEDDPIPPVDTAIEDLDPDLAALLSSPSSLTQERQAQKIQLKIQYVHNLASISDKTKLVLDALMKPIRIFVMDVSYFVDSDYLLIHCYIQNNQFHLVLDTFCKHKKLRKADVVLTFNDDVVFLSSTPAGMNMSPVGTNNMRT